MRLARHATPRAQARAPPSAPLTGRAPLLPRTRPLLRRCPPWMRPTTAPCRPHRCRRQPRRLAAPLEQMRARL
eukprot:scaffold192370_cov31-Tisochrysis_lutea.AAC.1